MKPVFVMLVALSAIASTSEPTVKWQFHAESNLYAPPLVADVCPSPGKETILSDSEARKLRCVDAQGKQIWEYDGHWTKRLTASAALSMHARSGKATLVIGDSDGMFNCIDAETGAELWRHEVGTLEWGSALWADLDGDGQDEIVAGTENAGIIALNVSGETRWSYNGSAAQKGLGIRCPIAATDVDGDGKPEIFAAGRFGPLCLNGDGTLRWETLTGDDYVSAVIVGDADADGSPELYTCSRDENAIHCFDARTGKAVWKTSMASGADSHPSSSMALGDIDGDGREELLVSDFEGYVYCVGVGGEVRWIYPIEQRAHAAPTLGDVDGDGRVEVMIAGADHYVDAVDPDGRLLWRYKAGLRIVSPQTLDDIDGDGRTDILFCGSDKTLYCLTCDGRYDPALVPWPSRSFDAAQSGASFGKHAATRETVAEIIPLLAFGSFDQGQEAGNKDDYPAGSSLYDERKGHARGWHAEQTSGGAWRRDPDVKREGASSARVDGPQTLASDLVEIAPSLRSVEARVAAKGVDNVKAAIRWLGLRGTLREDALQAGDDSEGWRIFAAPLIVPPSGARWVQMICTSGEGTAWWDDAQLAGTFARPYAVRPLVNQAGYEIGAPKRFTAQSNFVAKEARFQLIDAADTPVFEAPLRHEGRIHGAFGNDWGHEYWRGEFTEYDTPGTYRVRITLDGHAGVSWPFEVAPDVLWDKTSRPAYRFFYYQRCGTDVPGFHKACHLDDAASPDGKRQYTLWGGWHDAGDYNTYDNVPYVFGLLTAYGVEKPAFDAQDEDHNGRADFLDEILWGGEHTRRMIAPDGSAFGAITSGYGYWAPPELETDNIPNTGDERRIQGNETGNDSSLHAASMARIARFVNEKQDWIEAAERALNRALDAKQRGPLQFRAALDLYLATQDERWAALAKELFPGPEVDAADAVLLYDATFHEDHKAQLRERLIARADEILALAQNPFGVYTFGPKDNPNFFGTPAEGSGWHIGTSSHVLQAASIVALACQFEPDPRYFAFVYDQFNWILGNNPYDISLMEGAGSAFPPTYHHRYTFSGVPRGAVPGSVVNGIAFRAVHDDRPYFDMRGLDIPSFESNEVWLPHNTAYLNALANLHRARHRD